MPYCHIHLESPLDRFGQCNKCLWLNYDKNKKAAKIEKIKGKLKTNNTRQKLKAKLQGLVSRKMKAFYKEYGKYYCWIDRRGNNRKGLFGLHVSHYYAKSDIWQLWDCPENCGLSSYNRNVNKPETVALMRKEMINFWGEEKIKELDNKAHFLKRNIDLGIEPKYPPLDWLIKKIELLKNELKSKK